MSNTRIVSSRLMCPLRQLTVHNATFNEARITTTNFFVVMPYLALSTFQVLIIAQELWKEIQAQLNACDTVIQSKNDLIAQIKKDLKTKDNEFAKLLKQQSEDIDALLKHMNEQTKTMAEACRCGSIGMRCTHQIHSLKQHMVHPFLLALVEDVTRICKC
jgi:hypothetical protein